MLFMTTFLGTALAVPVQLGQRGRLMDANGSAITGVPTSLFVWLIQLFIGVFVGGDRLNGL